jgi:hypothetical protein
MALVMYPFQVAAVIPYGDIAAVDSEAALSCLHLLTLSPGSPFST